MPRLVLFGFIQYKGELDDSDHQRIFDLLHKYNEDWDDMPKELIWTVPPRFTKLHWGGMSFEPNFRFVDFRKKDIKEVWDKIVDIFREHKKEGFNDIQIIRMLESKKMIKVRKSDFRGCAWANGNENFAYKGVNFAIELSRMFPDKEMFLLDTLYRTIYCPLRLKGGLAKPDIKEVKERLVKVRKLIEDGDDFYVNEERYLLRISELQPDWGDPNQYIRPIGNYEGVNSIIELPVLHIDKNTMTEEEINKATKEWIEKVEKIEKEAKEKGINTGYHDDPNSFPEI